MNSLQLISPMEGHDLDQIMLLERSIYAFPWTCGNFSDSLASGYSAWLLKVGGQICGYAVMLVAAEEAQVLNISVAPLQQRTGIGSALLAHLRALAVAGGGSRMFLEVRRSNEAALAFYRRRGFRQIGERRGYYPAADGREDALVMELAL